MVTLDKKRRLTAKQERFAQAHAGGMTEADAYRKAYDAEASSDETIWHEATLLTQNPTVAPRIAELRERYAAIAEIDASYVLERVKATSEDAEREKEHSPALKGYELLGRHVGLFSEHTTADITVKHELDSATVEDLHAMLTDLQTQRLALKASAEVVEAEPDGEERA